MMKKIVLSLIFIFSIGISLYGADFSNESLHYVISYKWGLIHKDAGEAILSLRSNGDKYNLMLTAKTKPWADKFYMVRDTLKGVVRKSNLVPVSYTKITHENGYNEIDEIQYVKTGNITNGHVISRRIKEEGIKVTARALSATGPVYDMLSVFYYLRALDYSKLNKNLVYKATVFSGAKAETITIKSLGITDITLKDKTTHKAYHIKFNFTTKGGKKSSDDIDTWISTDPSHVPLYLVGKLPIGEVRAYLMNK